MTNPENTRKIIVAARIKELMKDESLSQLTLAKRLGVGQSTVSEWLSGKNEPGINSLWLLADYFSVTVDYLIGRKDF